MRNADKNVVEIAEGKVAFMGHTLPGADPKTFERLGGGWARDARHVYFDGQRIPKIHAASFRRFNQCYGTDRKGAFFRMVLLVGGDPKTFQALDSGLLLFEGGAFTGEETRGYAKDTRQVWFGHLEVRNADATSFSSLGNGFGRDQGNVYYREKQIVGADITSWRHWRGDMSLDEHNVFYRFKKVKDADRRTIRHLSVRNCIIDRHGVIIHDKRVPLAEYLRFTNLPQEERESLLDGRLMERILDEWPHSR